MNNIFSFKRFSNFFLYELNVLRTRHLQDILVVGLIPMMMGLIIVLLSLVKGRPFDETDFSSARSLVMVMIMIIPMLYPAKVFGFLTDKRQGADWTLIPVSRLEKLAVMMVVLLLVLPVLITALIFCSDAILAAAFPVGYGSSVLVSFFSEIPVSFLLFFALVFVNTTLTFLLGALSFKKGKIAKTLLCCFLVITVVSTVAGIIFAKSVLADMETSMFESFLNLDTADLRVNLVLTGIMLLLFAAVYRKFRIIQF